MKTIRELSEEIGVSKTAIRQKFTPEIKEKYIKNIDGKIHIEKDGEKLIKKAFSESKFANNLSESFSGTTENQLADSENRISEKVYENVLSDVEKKLSENMIAILQKELDIKNSQIKSLQTNNRELTNALENTTNALNVAHALHAGTFHQQARLTDQEAHPEAKVDKPMKKGFWAKVFNKGEGEQT